MRPTLPRAVHPGAWWGWALGLATAASQTSNPLLLALVLAVVTLVVVARRTDSPWARAYRLYLALGLLVIAVRVVLHLLVGLKVGTRVILPLPHLTLPEWAAGIELGGDVRLEGLLAAALDGARLATVLACLGAANALANPKRLLRTLPDALADVGTAVVVAVSVAPQLADSVRRVHRARSLRGDTARGLRAVRATALPVLEDTLERSLALAAAMDSRGYARHAPTRARWAAPATATGLFALALGTYGALDGQAPPWLGLPLLVVGVALTLLALLGAGRSSRSTHRPDPWQVPEWTTLGAGVLALAAVVVSLRVDPLAATLPLAPLAPPHLPLAAAAGLLVAALPAWLTPAPRPARRPVVVRRRVEVRVGD